MEWSHVRMQTYTKTDFSLDMLDVTQVLLVFSLK